MRLSNSIFVENLNISDAGMDEAYVIALMCYEAALAEALSHTSNLPSESFQSHILVSYNNKFKQSFISSFASKISQFKSQIDENIKLKITYTSHLSLKSIYTIESTYKCNGIARKSSMDLEVIFPELVFVEDLSFNVIVPEIPVEKKGWRILYGE
jgi:hypothetical protein